MRHKSNIKISLAFLIWSVIYVTPDFVHSFILDWVRNRYVDPKGNIECDIDSINGKGFENSKWKNLRVATVQKGACKEILNLFFVFLSLSVFTASFPLPYMLSGCKENRRSGSWSATLITSLRPPQERGIQLPQRV